ncbi:MAG: M23 family metallopeptidase, partial [Anaerolineales bacterium]
MDFQIILLPERDYWSWVRACKEYVMSYGANLTSDRETAGRYMAPMQVITLPISERLKAEYGDLIQWFDDHHQGVRVDAIPADSPAELESILRKRLQADDRYGQRQKPFYLLWPTQYPIITQKFGANPHIYTRFGMPGHEGLDIRALPYTDVYSCAQGTVYRVHTNPNSHAYGIHVRVRHKDGYRTVYGHLAKALVAEGQQLEAGQVLGKADSTGASTAAHLHLTLKQDGATARKETKYPKDVIDPTPFMVWPESSGKTVSAAPSWAAGRCLIGVHGRLGEPLTQQDLQVIQHAGFEAVKLQGEEPEESIRSLRSTKPNLFIVTRLSADLSAGALAPKDYLQAVQSQALSHYQAGVRHFELGAAPNLQLEGWNRSWRSGVEYSRWLRQLISGLRELLPEAALG